MEIDAGGRDEEVAIVVPPEHLGRQSLSQETPLGVSNAGGDQNLSELRAVADLELRQGYFAHPDVFGQDEARSATVGGSGGDPHVTTFDFVNGVNLSGLNKKDSAKLTDDSALIGAQLRDTLGNLISRQFRIAFAVEQSPDANNRLTLSSPKDALDLPRPKIAYNVSDYTKQGIAIAFRLKNSVFMLS